MKKLYFVRHGQSQHNADAVWSGQSETKLTKQGIKQARLAGTELAEKRIKIDVIISSPISRALHTSKLIAQQIDYPEGQIKTHPLLIERSFGILEGTPFLDYKEKHNYRDLDSIEGAETLEELHKRAHKALEYLKTIEQDNVLVVSHGTFGRALSRAVNNQSYTVEYDGTEIRFPNAEVIEFI